MTTSGNEVRAKGLDVRMPRSDCVWTITLDGEADKTFERLVGELSGYVVEVEPLGAPSFDARLVNAHTFQPVDEDGVPLGTERHLGRIAGIHVY